MTEPRLYIVMRCDLWDMNPGKAMAQAAHAQAEFDEYIEDRCAPEYLQDDPLWSAVRNWREDRSFGTTLVLHESMETMRRISANVGDWGMVTDPTYPYRNYYGEVFTRSEVTCMWVFAYTEAELEYMSQWRLHE
jgi:peptidyl-tRNA hydrolase